MSWFKKNEYTQGLVTLTAFMDESDSDYKGVIAEFSGVDFGRVVISGGTFTNLDILAPCAARLETLMLQGSVNTSFSGIEKLKGLVDLKCDVVSEKPYADFSSLTELKSCFLAWDKKYDAKGYIHGLFTLPKLKNLTLRYWAKSDCKEIAQIKQLEKLDLRQGALSCLDGLSECFTLRVLGLSYLPKLADIDCLGEMPWLEKVRIENCPKLVDLTPLTKIRNLRDLHVEKVNASFHDLIGLAQAHRLERICLSADILEIDWNVLFNHPTLSEVTISSHDGYSVPDSEILKIAESANRKVRGFQRIGTKKRPAFAFNLI